ncbi:MAG: HD domain-containing phosphohydrolase [Gemmatimonadota bacterium]
MSPGLLALTRSATALRYPRSPKVVVTTPLPAPAAPRSDSLVEPVEGRAGATTPLQVLPNSRATRGTSVADLKREPAVDGVRLSEVVGALSFALDLTEGQPMGHSVRTTLIGMKIGDTLGLMDEQKSALFYALLLKDLGCSSNAARLSSLFGTDDRLLKHAHKLSDWTANGDRAKLAFKFSVPGKSRLAKAWHLLMLGINQRGSERELMQTRCERGADIATLLGLPRGTSEAIRTLDEHWDGNGMPQGVRGSGIPMLGRIVSLAQTVEVFQHAFDVRTAYEMAHARRGRWFDPVLVDCLDAFQIDAPFWGGLREADTLTALRAVEPEERILVADDTRLDTVATAFARVIDAKSPYTARHSQNVASIAVAAATEMGLEAREVRTLNRAALLHDIGKLGVSNTILDKPGALTPVEVETMRQHTRFTLEILKRVPRFRQFAATAAAHHERLDGSGYHIGLRGEELGPVARILAVADVTEAISADRPYRSGMPRDEAFGVLDRLVRDGHLCAHAVEGVKATFVGLPSEMVVEEERAA